MGKPALKKNPFSGAGVNIEPGAILNALGTAVMVISADDRLLYANAAAEQLFARSRSSLARASINTLLPTSSPIFELIHQVRGGMSAITEHGVVLDTPKTGQRLVNVQAAPMVEVPDAVVLTFQERSIADQIDHRLTHRDATRTIAAMSAMMAHEVKNPLSGIRGAAQLLETGANEADQELTRLIQDEVDRIKELVERMEVFSESAPIKAGPVNIHQVLDRVRRIAENGFGRHVHFIAEYDPSLPPVSGNRDQLIQVFLNLIKNACEAVPHENGVVHMKTAYQHGVRFAMPGSQSRVHLPLAITICDNGPGVAPEMQDHMFDPFVTTKAKGSGLGLALVSKIVGDNGGVIDFKSDPGRTEFRILLPMSKEPLPLEDMNGAPGANPAPSHGDIV
ncbi:two-component system sensor histidine kinase NtrB [Magnetovibrio sp.]|uniref:two-component system sensor histidine kinase NtrB n=1 Tax=Magnetovibrio sp. TaxID=2024836 RepID=UPI002F93638B